MSNNEFPPISNNQPVSLNTFAERTGIPRKTLERYIKQGRLLGARKHVLTQRWWIYPPAKIVPSSVYW